MSNNDTAHCEICESEQPTGEMLDIGGDIYCQDCAQDVCRCCEEPAEYVHISKDGEPICELCMEDDRMEPAATIKFMDGRVATIGAYHDDTHGEFDVEWHSTDAWRGHYSVEAGDEWTRIHTDSILMMKNEQDIKEVDDKLMEYAEDHGIELARVITRTSNVCAQGYDLYAKASEEQVEELKQVAKNIEKHGVASAEPMEA